MAKSFYKLEAQPSTFPKTSLDELDKVEKHLNQGLPVSDWFGIRVYTPHRAADGKIVWIMVRNPPAKS